MQLAVEDPKAFCRLFIAAFLRPPPNRRRSNQRVAPVSAIVDYGQAIGLGPKSSSNSRTRTGIGLPQNQRRIIAFPVVYSREVTMKRFAFAIGLLALSFSASSPASADFAVVKFNSGYCRVWTGTAAGPQDGGYLWFRRHRGHHHWHQRFHTWAGAERALHRAAWHHRCHHWLG